MSKRLSQIRSALPKIGQNKEGQVTIFIIIAIVIVALGILIYMFYPEIKSTIGVETKNPSAYLQDCLEPDIKNSIEELALQGGSINPPHYIMYNGKRIEYLCYTNEYHKACVMQQPLLDNHIEEEIKNNIQKKAKECLNSLKESYENRNYQVNLKQGDIKVELIPKRILVKLNYPMTLSKENTETHDSFDVIVNNNIYELVSIANSILNWEANYGDAETTLYMNAYHDLKVEKLKQTEGSIIYILTDRNNLNKFQFASRSFAWPPGYG